MSFYDINRNYDDNSDSDNNNCRADVKDIYYKGEEYKNIKNLNLILVIIIIAIIVIMTNTIVVRDELKCKYIGSYTYSQYGILNNKVFSVDFSSEHRKWHFNEIEVSGNRINIYSDYNGNRTTTEIHHKDDYIFIYNRKYSDEEKLKDISIRKHINKNKYKISIIDNNIDKYVQNSKFKHSRFIKCKKGQYNKIRKPEYIFSFSFIILLILSYLIHLYRQRRRIKYSIERINVEIDRKI